MKKAIYFGPLILAIVFAGLSSLFLKVVKERELVLEEFPKPSSSSIQLFIEPDDGYRPVIEAIRQAKSSIDLTCYLLSDGKIINELIKAKGRGVKIRVILEREPYGDSPVNYRAKEKLKDAGIHFKWDPPHFLFTHSKVIIIDRLKVLIMTLNLCRSAFLKNREYGVIIEDPNIVQEIGRIFEADWKERSYHSREPNLVISPQNSRQKLTTLILRAKRRLWLQQLVLEDRGIMEALGDVAKKGVEVRVLLADPRKVEENLVSRRYLEEYGAKVRFQYRPRLHAKFISFDGEYVFIGSQNLSSCSLDLNRELGIILADRGIVSRLEETFLGDWSRAR